MALCNLSKDNVENLMLMLHGNKNENKLNIIKNNYMQYGKLKMIAKQIQMLKREAYEIINDAMTQEELHNLTCNFKIVSGNSYHLYEKNNKKYFSLIGPDEWNDHDESRFFLGTYFYDHDKSFNLV